MSYKMSYTSSILSVGWSRRKILRPLFDFYFSRGSAGLLVPILGPKLSPEKGGANEHRESEAWHEVNLLPVRSAEREDYLSEKSKILPVLG